MLNNIDYRQKSHSNQQINSMSIISICHMLLFVLLIPLVWFFVITVQSFIDYGWGIQHKHDMPSELSSFRSWFLFITFLYLGVIFTTYYLLFNNRQIINNKWVVIVPTLIPLLFFISIIDCLKNRYYPSFFIYLCTNRNEPKQISHKEFYLWITRKIRTNKLVRNTILFYLTLISFTIGFIFINVNPYYVNEIENFFIFNTMSFFTQQQNILCWIFLLTFLLLHKKIIFKDNALLTYNASYIFVVGIVALVMIGPYLSYRKGPDSFMTPYNIVKFLWLHLINQIFFLSFTINSFAQTYSFSRKSYKRFIFEGSIYPTFYGLYLYIIPFFSYYSVYGFLTNLNPFMLDSKGAPAGSPWWAFGAIALIIVFISSLTLFRFINIKICKNRLRYQYV